MSILELEVPRALRPLLQPKRYKGAKGGRGGAKSHFFAEQLLFRCRTKTTRAVCIREIQNSIRESVRQLLIDKISKLGLEADFTVLDAEIRCKRNGSLIVFKGMQEYNAENIKSLEGYDIAWVEEAQNLSARSLKMLRPTIRKDGSELWFSWNPRHKFDPVDEFFRENMADADFILVVVGWQDNPWFPESLRKDKDRDYAQDPVTAEHVWGGGYEVIAQGAYYAKEMIQAKADKRIANIPYEAKAKVYTAWDLGMDDCTAIWFVQQVGKEVRVIDYYENSGIGLDHYAKIMAAKPYAYADHLLPHDAEVRELGTGTSRVETLAGLGIKATVVPKQSVEDGINAARLMIPRCWFDETKCEKGIEALRLYRREYDEELRTYRAKPLHDWTSHAADAFRYLAIGLKPEKPKPKPVPKPKWVV